MVLLKFTKLLKSVKEVLKGLCALLSKVTNTQVRAQGRNSACLVGAEA